MAATPTTPLFKPFRALGYITDDVPFAVQRHGRESFVTVSVGRAWQVYNCTKLTLKLVGPQLKHAIRCLEVKGELTFAAVGRDIVECKRVHQSGVYAGSSGGGNVVQLLVLADRLLSLCEHGVLRVWAIGQYDAPEREIRLPAGLTPSCVAHPDTYLNKVLVGTAQGPLLLLNFATGDLIFTFGGFGAGVKCVISSPALDVVGVGLADGRAVLHNLRFDETVASFANASGVGLSNDGLLGNGAGKAATPAAGGGCTALSFRTGAGLPLMAAGGGSGAVTVWDLEQRKLHTVLRDAHDGPLLRLHFFPGEPLLMSAAADNSLKHWVFDATDGTGRLLRFRAGHSAPPTCVAHYGEGHRLLSAGRDRAFRVFSVIQDQQSRELSQKHTAQRAKRLKVKESELKLPRVVGMAASEVRERDWCNVITAHEGDPTAYTWRLQHFTIGEAQLRPPPTEDTAAAPDAPVTAVGISSCGNFGLVGTAAGRIDRYNMQSGLHRGSYSRKAAPNARAEQPSSSGRANGGGAAARGAGGRPPAAAGGVGAVTNAHDGAVVGLAVDSCNHLMVSGGVDRALRVWSFKQQALVREIQVGSGLTHLALHAGSALAAVACDDLVLRMYDIEAGRLVRRFKGPRDRVTALCISADSRWLMASAMDGTLRVWDVPASAPLQVLRLGAPVTSFSLSPSMELLATAHADRRGLYLWSNQAVFGNPADIVSSEQPIDAALPTVAAGEEQEEEEEAEGRNVQGSRRQRRRGGGGSDDSDDDSDEDDSERYASDDEPAPSGGSGGSAGHAAGNGAAVEKPYERRDVTGAPAPLLPSMVTLAMLPRGQWESLLHLEAIKARNKPLQPPKKPEAAPFFLPTASNAANQGRNPVFDLSADVAVAAGAKLAEAAAGSGGGGGGGGGKGSRKRVPGWGDSDDEENQEEGDEEEEEQQQEEDREEEEDGAEPAAARSRLRNAAGGGAGAPLAAATPFLKLLRSCGKTGDFSSLMAHMRGLSASALDVELRSMQLLEGATPSEVDDVGLLLDAIHQAIASQTNYEFCQALLQLVLQIHGDALPEQPQLVATARRIRERVAGSWARLDGLLQSVRCMVGYFGNLQA